MIEDGFNDYFVFMIAGKFSMIDEEDSYLLKGHRWSLRSGYVTKSARKKESLHRLIMGAGTGDVVDHIDGNPLNNCRSNLRLCMNSQNLKNRKLNKNNKSGFKGVVKSSFGNKWRARITSDGARIALGSFDTAEEANEAYVRAAKILHGDFHRPL